VITRPNSYRTRKPMADDRMPLVHAWERYRRAGRLWGELTMRSNQWL
jgi:hypothetical protein